MQHVCRDFRLARNCIFGCRGITPSNMSTVRGAGATLSVVGSLDRSELREGRRVLEARLVKKVAGEEEMRKLHNQTYLILYKQCHGPIGSLELSFQPGRTKFSDLRREGSKYLLLKRISLSASQSSQGVSISSERLSIIIGPCSTAGQFSGLSVKASLP